MKLATTKFYYYRDNLVVEFYKVTFEFFNAQFIGDSKQADEILAKLSQIDTRDKNNTVLSSFECHMYKLTSFFLLYHLVSRHAVSASH